MNKGHSDTSKGVFCAHFNHFLLNTSPYAPYNWTVHSTNHGPTLGSVCNYSPTKTVVPCGLGAVVCWKNSVSNGITKFCPPQKVYCPLQNCSITRMLKVLACPYLSGKHDVRALLLWICVEYKKVCKLYIFQSDESIVIFPGSVLLCNKEWPSKTIDDWLDYIVDIHLV